MEPSRDDFGLLPRSSRNAELQQLSLTALKVALVPFADRLLLRDERIDDTGVDCSLEVKHSGVHTNLRSQIQVKSAEKIGRLADGTPVRQIESSNLNYLLNQPSSLYVLYDAESTQLWYAWARDEHGRIETGNADWQTQQAVAIHFRNPLSPDAIAVIRMRIIEEGRFTRDLFEKLAKYPLGSRVGIEIGVPAQDIQDEHTIETYLIAGGASAIAAGQASTVLRLLGRLGSLDFRHPRLRLIAAFAEFSRGRYAAALAQMAESAVSGTRFGSRRWFPRVPETRLRIPDWTDNSSGFYRADARS